MPTTSARPPFDPELVAFLAVMDQHSRPSLRTEMLPTMRELGCTLGELDEQLSSRGLERRNVCVPGYQDGSIDLSVIQRAGRVGKAPCAYAIHGGGMMFGHYLANLDSYDWVFTHDAVLISVDYRLAPEYPDPVPVEDCYAGLEWAAANADGLGIDPDRIVLVGQSAGGGLAAGVALLARDRQGPSVYAQILVSPMLDDRDATVSAQQVDGVGVADRGFVRFAWDAYLDGRAGGEEVSVYAAPARATDLSDLPTTYIDCGSVEVFRDEAVAYASRIWEAGGRAELHVWPGAFHGFTTLVPDAAISRTAVASLTRWTERLLST